LVALRLYKLRAPSQYDSLHSAMAAGVASSFWERWDFWRQQHDESGEEDIDATDICAVEVGVRVWLPCYLAAGGVDGAFASCSNCNDNGR